MTTPLIFASAITRITDPKIAADELAQSLSRQLDGRRPDLALVFTCGQAPHVAAELAEAVSQSLGARILIGCTAESVIGREEEIENETAASVVAASLPGVDLSPFALAPGTWLDVCADDDVFRAHLGARSDSKLFILFCDPFTCPMDDLLDTFNTAYAGKPVIGGMASGGGSPGENVLFLNGGSFTVMNGGAVGVALGGGIEADVIVSQGCRPIGRPFTVTRAQRNVLLSLEDQPPMNRLQEVVDQLPEWDRELLKNGVFVGRAIDPAREELGRGDFLVRGVMGADPQRGFIAVGDYMHEGENVQFHLRDAATATEDLEMMLLPQTFLDPPAGAFLFSCNGRGTRLYDHPNGDVSTIQNILGGAPLAGFFCAGEIGPVGGKNFLHGHTASMVIFRQSPI